MNPLDRWAYFVSGHLRLVLVSCALVVIAGLALTPTFSSKLLGVGYQTPGSESAKATAEINRLTGYAEQATLVLSSDRYRVGDPAFTVALTNAETVVRGVSRDILVLPPGAPFGGEVAADTQAVSLVVAFKGPAAQRQAQSLEIQQKLDPAMPAGVAAGLTGNSPLMADLLDVEHTDMVKAELVGLPLAFLVLVVAFGSVLAAGLPLLLGVCSLMIAFGVIAVIMLVMDFNVFTESIVAMIGLGVGIDYALLVVRRYREELTRTSDLAEALAIALSTAGRTVAFSGAILCTSIIPLAVTGLPFFGEAAIGCIVVIAANVILTLTLLPAMLLSLGKRIDKWPAPKLFRRGGPGGGWERWARKVMNRPLPVMAIGLVVLLACAAPGLGVRTGVDLNARAMQGRESVKALHALQTHFPASALAPVQVLVHGGSGALTAAEAAVHRTERFAAVTVLPLSAGTSVILGSPTRDIGVDTNGAAQLVRDLRGALAAGTPTGSPTPQVTGLTAETVDYTAETNRVQPWVTGLALLLSFVLLLWVFRSPLLAVKAIVMNLLSIGASFGLVVLFFQQGLGEQIFGFTSPGYIQSWMPLTLFMLLFGLSMDYEVFMVSRMREEWERTGDTVEAVARGLDKTGGVVTSAAAIMTAIFASFILTTIPEMKQMGFGLAAAVVLDATIVRAALVPAFMKLAGRWNWWMPRWLDQILPRLSH